MNAINISKNKFNELKKMCFPKEVLNTESTIYDFSYKGNRKVIKSLFNNKGPIFANKLYTIEMLDTNREYLPYNFYIPDYLITKHGNIIGFTVPYIDGINFATILKNNKLLPSEQIYYLKRVGEILEQLKNIRKYTPLKNIFINDLNESNFIVNPKSRELYVIDLDSCRIENNASATARYLTPFSLLNNLKGKYNVVENNEPFGYVKANENSDLYCYNIIILNYLFGKSVNNMTIDEFYSYLNYLEYIGINKNLIESFNSIIINKKNQNPANYLDTLTNKEVYRAKEIVYKKLKK